MIGEQFLQWTLLPKVCANRTLLDLDLQQQVHIAQKVHIKEWQMCNYYCISQRTIPPLSDGNCREWKKDLMNGVLQILLAPIRHTAERWLCLNTVVSFMDNGFITGLAMMFSFTITSSSGAWPASSTNCYKIPSMPSSTSAIWYLLNSTNRQSLRNAYWKHTYTFVFQHQKTKMILDCGGMFASALTTTQQHKVATYLHPKSIHVSTFVQLTSRLRCQKVLRL